MMDLWTIKKAQSDLCLPLLKLLLRCDGKLQLRRPAQGTCVLKRVRVAVRHLGSLQEKARHDENQLISLQHNVTLNLKKDTKMME